MAYRIYVHAFSDQGPTITEIARVENQYYLQPVTRAIVRQEGATHTVFAINSNTGGLEGAWLGLMQQAGANRDETERGANIPL